MAGMREPVATSTLYGSWQAPAPAPLRIELHSVPAVDPDASNAAATIALTRSIRRRPELPRSRSEPVGRVPAATRSAKPLPMPHGDAVAAEGRRPVESPSPLTYPVIPVPPDDDPHRVGMVRLMLVVSSDGRVARSIVLASTLPQDYVDRIALGFDDMRFEPARAGGLPRAGWFEVVVNFDFDPGPSTLL